MNTFQIVAVMAGLWIAAFLVTKPILAWRMGFINKPTVGGMLRVVGADVLFMAVFCTAWVMLAEQAGWWEWVQWSMVAGAAVSGICTVIIHGTMLWAHKTGKLQQ